MIKKNDEYIDIVSDIGANGEAYSTPKLVIFNGDKISEIEIPDIKDGETKKVEFYWNTMPDTGHGIYVAISSKTMNLGLDFEGACEYIIDNVKSTTIGDVSV